jgi:1-acyl-sn-glycerol-3-phosphate acyltransferase
VSPGRLNVRVRDIVYPPVIRTALMVFRIFGFRFDMRGIEHIPASGGAVLASNHVSYFDFMFVGLPAWRRGKRFVRFMAKEVVFRHRVSGPLMRGMHHIPVDRAAGAAAYRHALAALRHGEIVGVFPESTIARSFVQRPLKTGAARLALEADVPLIPVVVWGGHRVWTTGRRPRWQRRVPVFIWVDKPLAVAADDTPTSLTDRLALRLREMVEEVLRDYPMSDLDRSAWWWPAHLGGGAPTQEAAAMSESSSISGRRPA